MIMAPTRRRSSRPPARSTAAPGHWPRRCASKPQATPPSARRRRPRAPTPTAPSAPWRYARSAPRTTRLLPPGPGSRRRGSGRPPDDARAGPLRPVVAERPEAWARARDLRHWRPADCNRLLARGATGRRAVRRERHRHRARGLRPDRHAGHYRRRERARRGSVHRQQWPVWANNITCWPAQACLISVTQATPVARPGGRRADQLRLARQPRSQPPGRCLVTVDAARPGRWALVAVHGLGGSSPHE